MFSAVDGQLGAQEVACEPSGLHLPCVRAHTHGHGVSARYLVCRRPKLSLPSLTAGARAGAAGVRRVCGMSVGPRAICHVRLAFVNIEG